MKRSTIFVMLFICIKGFSQITLDFQTQLKDILETKLSNTTTKYLDNNQFPINKDQFTLYNLDGTFYKTVVMPAGPVGSTFHSTATYITVSLFDNDPSTIEYIVWYISDSIPGQYSNSTIRIIREDGTILFSEYNAGYPVIYSTEEGTKLRVTYYFANNQYITTKVFNLPGELPSSVNDINGITDNNSIVYPNPNNGSFYIRFNSNPIGIYKLELYSSTGSLIETFKSNENPVHINTYQNLPQ